MTARKSYLLSKSLFFPPLALSSLKWYSNALGGVNCVIAMQSHAHCEAFLPPCGKWPSLEAKLWATVKVSDDSGKEPSPKRWVSNNTVIFCGTIAKISHCETPFFLQVTTHQSHLNTDTPERLYDCNMTRFTCIVVDFLLEVCGNEHGEHLITWLCNTTSTFWCNFFFSNREVASSQQHLQHKLKIEV